MCKPDTSVSTGRPKTLLPAPPRSIISGERVFTLDEIKESNEKLFIIEHVVYKVPEKWSHPGGETLINFGRNHDVTVPFVTNHSEAKVAPVLKRFRVGRMEDKYAMTEMETSFVALTRDVYADPAWFKASMSFYAVKCLWYAVLLAVSVWAVLVGSNICVRVLLGGLAMGTFFQQVAFIGHDLGHNGITHDKKTDRYLGYLFGNTLTGISVGWWKATHNVHHLATNSLEYDCDIQHMPVFAISEKFFKGFHSEYHGKHFHFDAVARILLQFQHLLYYPIMMNARFNLYIQSFMLLLSPEYNKRGGYSRSAELTCLCIFWTWFGLLISFFPSKEEMVGFVLVSHMMAGLLHIQITLSHFAMPVIEGNPLDGDINFVQYQLQGTADVDCPKWLDWVHGGLQFQAVHHCLPMVPRHNLRRLREEVMRPWCKRHGVEYHSLGWIELQCVMLKTLKDTADQVKAFALQENKKTD